jgi:non-ribosomal peptide synthetase component F
MSSSALPESACLGRFIEAPATQTPEATVAVGDGLRLSFREVNESANQFAHHLRANGRGDATTRVQVETEGI